MSPDSALREITLPFADPTGQAASPLEAALASAARLGGFPPTGSNSPQAWQTGP